MSRRTLENRHTRKLIKGTTSYMVTLPIEFIRALGWRDNQNLVVEFDERRRELIVRDWQK